MAGGRDTTGPVALPLFLEPPDAPSVVAAIVAAINTRSKRLTAVIKRLFEETGSGGDDITEPESVELPIDRPAVNGSSLTFHAVHRSTDVSATRAAELNHAKLFASTAIRTALNARNDMRNQLRQIADNAAGTLHKQNNATHDWKEKGPPMLAEIGSATGKVIEVTENTNGTMQRAAGLVKSILNEWPDPQATAYTQQLQREQLAIITDLMTENPAGNPDGMAPIPGKSPIESFRDSLDRFGGFVIVHGLYDPQAALNFASILPLVGPAHGGAKHFAIRMLEPKDQGALDALVVAGDSGPLSELLDRYKTSTAVYNHAGIEGVKEILRYAADAGYQLHAVGGKDRAIGNTVYTAAQESRDIIANRIPEGEKFIFYGDPRETEFGSNPAAPDNVIQVPSYKVVHPMNNSFLTVDWDAPDGP